MTVSASEEEENLPMEPREQTATHYSPYQTARKCLLCPQSKQADMKCGNYLSLILSIINTFHLHSVLFFLVTTPCSSPHSLSVLFCAFPHLLCVYFLYSSWAERHTENCRLFFIICKSLHICCYMFQKKARSWSLSQFCGVVVVFSVLLCQLYVICK